VSALKGQGEHVATKRKHGWFRFLTSAGSDSGRRACIETSRKLYGTLIVKIVSKTAVYYYF
jgi:hypothetical protein